MSNFVISLDFEMFWGVSDSRSIENYSQNIRGVWDAIPKILKLFDKYKVQGTWATVGMLMCKDHAEWLEIQPSQLPGYVRRSCSNYNLSKIAKEYPELFFGLPLVQQIADTVDQEIASHTYSHFYCGEKGATTEQFLADMNCAKWIAKKNHIELSSFVFPRNQVLKEFVDVLPKVGIYTYRSNPDHFLYRDGHTIPGGILGRAARLADGWLPLSFNHIKSACKDNSAGNLINIPASLFLRPYSPKLQPLEQIRLARMKRMMTAAAKNNGLFHLWWHPHNFGVNTDLNLAVLESLLKHFIILNDQFGMNSATMGKLGQQTHHESYQYEHNYINLYGRRSTFRRFN